MVVGFLDGDADAENAILVAAGDPDADWARNLEMDPRCRVTVGDRSWDAFAESLEPLTAGRVVTGLILKYGTSAERLGRGPAFRLRPVAG